MKKLLLALLLSACVDHDNPEIITPAPVPEVYHDKINPDSLDN